MKDTSNMARDGEAPKRSKIELVGMRRMKHTRRSSSPDPGLLDDSGPLRAKDSVEAPPPEPEDFDSFEPLDLPPADPPARTKHAAEPSNAPEPAKPLEAEPVNAASSRPAFQRRRANPEAAPDSARPFKVAERVQPDLLKLEAEPSRQTDARTGASHSVVDPHAVSWGGLAEIRLGVKKKPQMKVPLAGFFRDDPASKAFDLLRTRLVQTLRANGWSRIAIAAPTFGCGSTFTAVNLALSLARVPASRTILMDLNQRDPGIADALEVADAGDMTAYLSGKVPTSQFIMRCSKTLALGLNRRINKNAAELLHDPSAAHVLDRMTAALQPDVTIFDMPPVLQYDDLPALLPMIDGVLLVSDGTRTTARHIAECERILEGQTQLLGVILNRARASSILRFDA